jgi:DtxR family transcriptional regulator, Mn-dependent transcriptional regulator
MHSFTEENYIKAIYKLQEQNGEIVVNSELAKAMKVHSASVTDMLIKMAKKKLINYEKSKGFKLTEKGRQIAVSVIRKHRLWEVFLLEKLGFKWDEVHDIAEQLEHISNESLINRLDIYLGHPKADPHGDPIPNANGVFAKSRSIVLSEMKKDEQGKFTGVIDHSPSFLTYLDKIGLTLGETVKIKTIEDYDHSFTIQLKGKKELTVSSQVASNILISG